MRHAQRPAKGVPFSPQAWQTSLFRQSAHLRFGHAHGLAKARALALYCFWQTDGECHDLNYKTLADRITFTPRTKVRSSSNDKTKFGGRMTKKTHSYP
jgi:hypothetical protein